MASSPGMAASGGAIVVAEDSASRTLSASWMADSAASVGSFIFGVFAMSVVASSVTLDQVRGSENGPRRERVSSSPLEWSSGSGLERAAKHIPLPLGYPIGLADQRKPLVKFSLIIVNAAPPMIKASGAQIGR